MKAEPPHWEGRKVSYPARVPQLVGPGKDFQKKNGLLRSNSRYSKTERDIVIGPTAKMVSTHRAPLVQIWVTQVKNRVYGQNAPGRVDFG